jgi:hypothetical protein
VVDAGPILLRSYRNALPEPRSTTHRFTVRCRDVAAVDRTLQAIDRLGTITVTGALRQVLPQSSASADGRMRILQGMT